MELRDQALLRWEGVTFAIFYDKVIAPSLRPDASVGHIVFGGLDGYRFVVAIEDALAEDVLIADHLDGRALDSDHGAPVRLVSPSQYGYVSVKHLCRIELHASQPEERYHPATVVQAGLLLVKPHRRARVWHEERHRYLPARALRLPYRLLIKPIMVLSARGSRRSSG